MNTLLQTRYQQLSPSKKTRLKKEFESSPKMVKLIELLERPSAKKFGIKEAVDFIYSKEQEDFEVLRNRFFKLRKKFIESLDKPEADQSHEVTLMPLEAELYRCRQLVTSNNFQPAKDQLIKLIKTCRERNIFELLPDALHLLVFCNLALNLFKENEELNKELEESNELLFALNRQRQLARNIYQKVVERSDAEIIKSLFKELNKIATKFSKYPRLTLYYHFTVASQGPQIFNESKTIQKSFSILKDIIAKHPHMPIGFYEPYADETIRFYIAYAEGMQAFHDGDVFAAYNNLIEAWKIMEAVPGLRSKKTESNYSNKIAIEVATKRYSDALNTAAELLEFLLEQKSEEKRLKAYSEIVQIHTYAFPTITHPDPDFLEKKINEYIRTIGTDNVFVYQGTKLNKALFLVQNGRFDKASKFLDDAEFQAFLSRFNLSYYADLIQAITTNDKDQIASQHELLEKRLNDESKPEVVFPLQRAVATLLHFKRAHN